MQIARLVLMGLVGMGGGCASAADEVPARRDAVAATQPAQSKPPYILHLPGIGGPLSIDRAFAAGLEMAKLPGVDIYDWTVGDAGLNALGNYQRNQRQAEIVAQKLTDQYRRDPDRPIVITGHSGGTGIAVWALEKLPKDVKVTTVLLMASALSPAYDLSPAMTHVSGRVYAIYSPHDNIILGAGTRTLGTIDRVYTDAAGMVGFTTPEKPKVAGQYDKLVSMPYVADWLQLGNPGDHIGPMRRLFAAQVLSPLLGGVAPRWVTPTTRAATTSRSRTT